MEYSLLAGGVGLFIGVLLGVFLMTLLAASDRDKFPMPAPVPTRALGVWWPEVPESSLVGIGVSRDGESGLGLVDPPHGVSAIRARDSA